MRRNLIKYGRRILKYINSRYKSIKFLNHKVSISCNISSLRYGGKISNDKISHANTLE